MNISIFGGGAWGTALAVHAAAKHSVVLWCRDANQAGQMQSGRLNARYLPDIRLPDELQITADWQHAVDQLSGDSVAVIATPLAGLSATLKALDDSLRGKARDGLVIANLSKGLEADSLNLPHQVAKRDAPNLAFVSVSGPSFAAEVARGLPVALAAAGANERARQLTIDAFHHQAMRVYGTNDVIGVELAAALKNVIAIAAGACDGLALGLNARAALITRGLSEITNIGVALGARADTFQGLAGFGDLVLTCTGALSRNRQVGMLLAQRSSTKTVSVDSAASKASAVQSTTNQTDVLAEITASLGHVAEGVACAAAAHALATRLGVDAPIVAAVNQVLFNQLPTHQAVANLLARAQKNEL